MTYMPKELQKVVGTRPIRPDGVDKVTGKANFGADMVMPGMLWGKVKRSPHAHARIMSINTEKARALPGVKAVVTWEDFPPIPSEEAVTYATLPFKSCSGAGCETAGSGGIGVRPGSCGRRPPDAAPGAALPPDDCAAA